MYYTVSYTLYGNCPEVDFSQELDNAKVVISEDLRDAIPYLYEEKFGVPYRELGWWLEPGAKEWMKEIEDLWLHNKLDLSHVYADEEFLKSLATNYITVSEESLDDVKDEFEEALRDELEDLDEDELKELHEYDDTVTYTIEDEDGRELAFGYVYLPELEEDED